MRSFKQKLFGFGEILAAVVLFPAFALSAAGDVVVTSMTMEADSKAKVVIFKGDVVAERVTPRPTPLRGTHPEDGSGGIEDFILCSDELTIYYGAKDEIKEIIAVGNVRVAKGDKRAAGDRAVYDKGKNAIVITGNAVAEQCSDVVKGGKITLYTDSDSMTVEGGDTPGKRVKAVIMPEKKCVEGSGKVTPFSKGAGFPLPQHIATGSGGIDEKFKCERPR
ncbi:MAG: LptA/OstA family protein [Thermodesulfobacteriota bacterium]